MMIKGFERICGVQEPILVDAQGVIGPLFDFHLPSIAKRTKLIGMKIHVSMEHTEISVFQLTNKTFPNLEG